MKWFILLWEIIMKTLQKLQENLLFLLMAILVVSCGSSGSNGSDNSHSNNQTEGNVNQLSIIAPSSYPVGVASTLPIVIVNNESIPISSLS